MNTAGINKSLHGKVVGGTAEVIAFASRSRSPAAALQPVISVIEKIERAMLGLNEALSLYNKAAISLGKDRNNMHKDIDKLVLDVLHLEYNLANLRILSSALKSGI